MRVCASVSNISCETNECDATGRERTIGNANVYVYICVCVCVSVCAMCIVCMSNLARAPAAPCCSIDL